MSTSVAPPLRVWALWGVPLAKCAFGDEGGQMWQEPPEPTRGGTGIGQRLDAIVSIAGSALRNTLTGAKNEELFHFVQAAVTQAPLGPQ